MISCTHLNIWFKRNCYGRKRISVRN